MHDNMALNNISHWLTWILVAHTTLLVHTSNMRQRSPPSGTYRQRSGKK